MELPLPNRIHIEPVGRGRSGTVIPAPLLMSFAAYCRLLEQFPAAAEIELSAPVDPLLHPRFFDMVRHAAAHGLRVSARSALLSLSDRAAEDCIKSGDSWVHLRLCLECGHVGCCDSSKNKHATKHFHRTKHPLIRSIEPGEAWIWCYVDELSPGEIAA